MGNPRPYKDVRAKLAAKRAARGPGRPKHDARPPEVPREHAMPAALPGLTPAAPTPGRIVLVHRTVGAAVPAIVTHVHVAPHEGEPPTVSLVVFDPMNGEDTLPASALRWVRYGTQPGEWSWAPRTA